MNSYGCGTAHTKCKMALQVCVIAASGGKRALSLFSYQLAIKGQQE